MIKTNQEKLVKIAVSGKVAPALARPGRVAHDGRISSLPGVGSITYNVLVGDNAFGWAADHVEPSVTTLANPDKRAESENITYNFLSCIGNTVRVISGDAKGATGTVTGKHGGLEHVICDFAPDVMEKLTGDDKVQIISCGQGLRFTDYPEINLFSLSPELLSKMGLKEGKGHIEVPVCGVIPGVVMGSGLGKDTAAYGDYDVMTSDWKFIEENGLDKLKLGDVVAISDYDASYGRRFLRGSVVIGVVIHGDSVSAGHGPGITALMTGPNEKLRHVVDKDANIGKYFGIGRFGK